MSSADDAQMGSVGADDRNDPVTVASGAGPSSDEPMLDAAEPSDAEQNRVLREQLAQAKAELARRPMGRPYVDAAAPATVTGARLADVEVTTRLARLEEHAQRVRDVTNVIETRLDSVADGNRSSRLPKPPKPDKFSGADDVRKVGDFIALTELWLRIERVPDQQWSVFGMQFLSGMASDHFASVTRGVDVMTMPWSRFREILNSAYGKPDSEPAARLALDTLKWPGSVSGLARKLGELVSQITRMPLSVGDQIYRFQKSLPPVLGDKCRAKPDGSPWDSLPALIEFAAMHETYLPSLSANSAVIQSRLGVANGSGVQKTKGGVKTKSQSNGGNGTGGAATSKSSGRGNKQVGLPDPSLTRWGIDHAEHAARLARGKDKLLSILRRRPPLGPHLS